MEIAYIAPETAVMATLLEKADSIDKLKEMSEDLLSKDENIDEIFSTDLPYINGLISFDKSEESIDLFSALLFISSSDHFFMNKRDAVTSGERHFVTVSLLDKYESISKGNFNFKNSFKKEFDKDRFKDIVENLDEKIKITSIIKDEDGNDDMLLLFGSAKREIWNMLSSFGRCHFQSSMSPSIDCEKEIPGMLVLFRGGISALGALVDNEKELPDYIRTFVKRLPLKKEG